MIFVLGGCFSFYHGLILLKVPEVAGDVYWNYMVLGLALIFTAVSFFTSLKVFNHQRGSMRFWEAIKLTKDPPTIIVLLGDVGDILGLLIAFAGVTLGHLLHNTYYDRIASMLIGVVLVIISFVLVRESKSLLLGETISRRLVRRVIGLVQQDGAVVKVNRYLSTYMAPEEILLQLDTIFKNDLTTQQITDAIERIVHNIRERFPHMKQIFIEPVKA